MDIPGYTMSILYVDLTTGKIHKEAVDPELVRMFIGGWGISLKLAYDLIPPRVDALSPENAIIVGTGPFTGTISRGQLRHSSRRSFLLMRPLPQPPGEEFSPACSSLQDMTSLSLPGEVKSQYISK